MSKAIYVIGGSKGGVGKSKLSLAVIDYLTGRGGKVLVIESDTSNPDVYKCYKDEVRVELLNLDDADGWIQFVNVCDEAKDSVVVVNTAARNNIGVGAYGGTLNSTLAELKRKLVTLWLVNRQRDSLELLKEYLEAMTNGEVHVVRNAHFGDASRFELYNNSNLKGEIEGKGGKSLVFPDLADRVADDLYCKRLSIAKAMQELPIGNRAELARWRGEVAKMLAEVIK